MKKFLFGLLSIAVMGATSCSKGSDDNTPVVPTDTTNVTLTGDISTNTTLYANKKYTLKGFVYVTNQATLTIEPGTVIMGDKATKGTLIITRGAKIMAEGTAAKPIVFTSSLAKGARNQGDWGGVILLGKAPINPTGGTAKIEGGLTPTGTGAEADYIYYGGTDANDNSGTMKYCRIEFAGIAFSPDNEINGLTFGGVGAGTTISYIQVYRSGDDAFEWFGGTVNCDHLMATYSWDDDFDTDFGFSGKVQFGVAQRAVAVADVSGSNGFESDNDGNGTTNSPQTKAVFSNMTIVGPMQTASSSGYNANFQHAAQIRRTSSESIVNSILMGFPLAGVYIDDSKVTSHKTSDNANEGSLVFRNNIIAGCKVVFKYTNGWANADTWWASTNTDTSSAASFAGLTDPFKYAPFFSTTAAGRPNYLLKAGSPALSGASFAGLTGFQNVSYRGAFDGTNDWTSGWATFDAENNTY